MVDVERLFYIYCVNMRLSESEFWKSSMGKVIRIAEMYSEDLEKSLGQPASGMEVREITSMKEIEGW